MLQQPMINKMLAMRLHGMAEALKAQEHDGQHARTQLPGTIGTPHRSAMESAREPSSGTTVEKCQATRQSLCGRHRLPAARGLDKSVMRALTQESGWVKNHENVFVLGPTGVGKSFMASALAQKACRDGYSAFYTRAVALFREFALARADGSFRHLLARISRIDVLVVDDWAMAPLTETERRDFWENLRGALSDSECDPDLANARRALATSKSVIPQSPMAYWTAWFTMPTGSRCAATRCEKAAAPSQRADSSLLPDRL